MSDPFIRSQSNRPTLGSNRPSAGGLKPGTPSDVQVAEAYLKSSQPTGTREKLNNFLSKLETTWQLFNRSSTDSAKGELPKDGRLALLEEGDTPTPETLKMLRARFKEQARKPDKGGEYLFRTPGQDSKTPRAKEGKLPHEGPKQSPQSDRNTPRAPSQPTTSSDTPAALPKPPEAPQAEKDQAHMKEGGRPTEAPKKENETQRSQNQTKYEPPRVSRESTGASGQESVSTGRGSVLGRKPGSSETPQFSSTPKQGSASPEGTPEGERKSRNAPTAREQRPSSQPLGQRRPQLLRRPDGPAGSPTSKSFLGSSAQARGQLRSSDAAGRPGRASHMSVARQAVFSQAVAQVSPRLTTRQVSSEMPIHSSFLDECHEDGGKDKEPGPIRLSWNSGKPASRSIAQRMFAHRQRLQFNRNGQAGQMQRLGAAISMSGSALAQARADVSTRIAGAAIGSLLKDLYDEEDVESLDEETAVTSLGLILRLGGEFTYKHSTRVLDLALELADEVGIRDKQTRKEIKFGAMFRDLGEFDLLLQSGPDTDKRMKEFSGFLAGQDMLRAGLLHDIGKVQIPPEILYKPGKLTPEEYEIMKMHPIYGEEIVRPIASLRYLCPTIRGHHERWDGKGYPDGLSGESIPLAARIISVADVFDALAAERPYKRGMEVAKVKTILAEGRGTHFDPFLVDAFLQVIERRHPS